MKILYIEDDPSIAEKYSGIIEEAFPNIEINYFSDGVKALEELKQNSSNYSLVISDYKLPNITGGEIFKFVNGQMLGIPFIILSGLDCSNDENLKGFFDSHLRNALLVKPVDIEELTKKIEWCLTAESDLLKIYNKNTSSSDEYIPVPSSAFMKLNYVPCDVFLKLRDNKYVKVINKNEIYESTLIQKLILKGVSSFFIKRSEMSQYNESTIKSLQGIIKTKKNKLDATQKSQLTSQAIEVLKNNLLKCGFSHTVLEATDEMVELQLDLINSTPEFNQFLEKFQNFRKIHTDHTRIVSYITVAILKYLTWDSESTLHRMCFASLLHDLTLSDAFLQRNVDHEQLENLSEEDKAAYLNHPEESAHLAKNFDSAANGIDQFILEHHELPDGKGFPRKLNFNHVHPLSAVLHMADFVADLMWEHDFDDEIISEVIKEKRSFYARGFYRKPYDAVSNIFKKV